MEEGMPAEQPPEQPAPETAPVTVHGARARAGGDTDPRRHRERQRRRWTDRCSSAPSTAAICLNSTSCLPVWRRGAGRQLRWCPSRWGVSGRSQSPLSCQYG